MFDIFKFFKDILAPKKCYSCQQEWHFLCEKCFEKIWFFPSICPICKLDSQNFEVHVLCQTKNFYLDKVIILTNYQNKIIQKLIKDAKFYGKKDILEDLSLYLWKKLLWEIDEKKEDIILIYTPMYFWKKLKRWYNQSELLSKYIAQYFWISSHGKFIKKLHSTPPQSHLSKKQRIQNLKGSFSINQTELWKYKNKTFIIVDDVVSTGSTLNEIAKLLKNSGIQNIYWLCVASD